MALSYNYTFVNDTIAEAAEVNANFSAVKLFVDALQDGTGISSGAITDTKLATSSVTEIKIAGLAVTEGKIADGSVTNTKIADNAVTQSKIADRAIGSAELKEISLNPQTVSYTPVLSDAQKIVTMNSGSALNFTIPTDASVAFQIGDQINILQLGLGAVTISAVTPGTTTVVSQGSKLKTNGQYAMATAVKVAANQWVVVGNLAV
jgi:hypothetical protein